MSAVRRVETKERGGITQRRLLGTVLILSLLSLVGGSCPGEQPAAQTGAPGAHNERLIEMLNGSHGFERSLLLARLLAEATNADVEEFRKVFEARQVIPSEVDLHLFTLRWAGFDPGAAFDWAAGNSAHLGWAVRAQILQEWARAEPKEAARRASKAKASAKERLVFSSAVAAGWFLSGQPGLSDYVRSLDAAYQREAIGNLVEVVLAHTGPSGLMEWADSFDVDGKALLRVRRATATMLGASSSEHAKTWIDRHSREGEVSNLIRLAAVGWSTRDGREMISWLETLPASKERDFGVEEGFKRWHRKEPEIAAEWIESAGVADWLDPAHLVYSARISQGDAQRGFGWAAKIQREEIRNRALARIVRRWRLRDKEAARSWIDEQTDLSEPLRAMMLAPVGKGSR